MHIGCQVAGSIVNVENHEPRPDRLGNGVALLRDRHYSAAAHVLTRAVEDGPDDAEAHYYLALALLGGARPHRHTRPLVDEVRRHLDSASALPQAKVLRVLVDEDQDLLWRRYTAVSPSLVALAARVDPAQAAEILTHVPAPEARTFQVLREVAAR